METLIDWTAPIELDDGRPARAIERDGPTALVEITGPYRRGGAERKEKDYWWYTDKGIWDGGNAVRHFTIRNVEQGPEEIEAWRL